MDKTVTEHMRSIQRSGNQALMRKHGPDYFSKLAKKRWKKRKLAQQKKAA